MNLAPKEVRSAGESTYPLKVLKPDLMDTLRRLKEKCLVCQVEGLSPAAHLSSFSAVSC